MRGFCQKPEITTQRRSRDVLLGVGVSPRETTAIRTWPRSGVF